MEIVRSLWYSFVVVTNRMQKFDELILQELSRELLIKFPGSIFSLTQVHVSKDLSFAKVWVSSVDNPLKLVERFNASSGELRKTLSEKVVARRVPKLFFVVDDTEEKAEKIDKLFLELEKEKKQ